MVERTEDLNLPTSVVTRIMKEAIPDGVAVSKEARSAISKAASVFVLYATSSALTVTQKNKKKTLSAQDVLTAMKEMEFEKFVEPLEESLENYRQLMQTKKDQKEAKTKAAKKDEDEANTSKSKDDTDMEMEAEQE